MFDKFKKEEEGGEMVEEKMENEETSETVETTSTIETESEIGIGGVDGKTCQIRGGHRLCRIND